MNTQTKKIKLMEGDKTIWSIYLILILISVFSVFSAMNNVVINKQNGSFMPMFFKHLFMLALGLATALVVHKIDVNKYAKYSKTFLYISIALLIAPIMSSYPHLSEARWWGFSFLRFQPSEIAKYVLIFYLSKQMDVYKSSIASKDVFLKLMGALIVVCALIFLPNLSTALMVFIVGFILLLVGGVNRKYLFKTLLVFVGIFLLLVIAAKSNPKIVESLPRGQTWVNRVNNYGNDDPTQINQRNRALIAIATGGILGKFIGNSQESPFLDEGHNDFIFAIMLEEGGFFWGIVIVGLYLTLFIRIFMVAKQSQSIFEGLVCIGIGSMLALQTLVNMAVAVGLAPVTGQTLPFISYGGTSFVISSFFLAIVLNISKKSKVTQKVDKAEQPLSEQTIDTLSPTQVEQQQKEELISRAEQTEDSEKQM